MVNGQHGLHGATVPRTVTAALGTAAENVTTRNPKTAANNAKDFREKTKVAINGIVQVGASIMIKLPSIGLIQSGVTSIVT
jgi:hypothetical protein